MTSTIRSDRQGMRTPMKTFPFVVTEPGGPFNRYRRERATETTLLDAVDVDVRVTHIERGYLRDTADEHGAPLAAIMPARVPTFPGCVVRVRPIAIANSSEGEPPLVVAIGEADAFFAEATRPGEVPEPYRTALEAAIRDRNLSVGNEVVEFVSAAQAAGLRAKARARAGGLVAAWKSSDVRAPLIEGRESERHTLAERGVRRLPLAFQEYVERVLLPGERILLFIHRPQMTGRGFLHAGKREPEAILVVTDRQLMFVSDVLDPDATNVHWGYSARICAVERVVSAVLVPAGDRVRLDVGVEATGGQESLPFTFSRDAADAVEDAARMLRRFAAVTAAGRALRRQYSIDTLEWPRGMAAPADEHAPDWCGPDCGGASPVAWAESHRRGRGGSRLAVSHRFLWLTPGGGQEAIELPVGAISSLALTLSPVESGLELAVPEGERAARHRLDFEYTESAPFLRAVIALRQLMGQPPHLNAWQAREH